MCGLASRSRISSGIARNIMLAWLITIPAAALVGAGIERLTRAPAGDALALIAALAVGAGAFYARTRPTAVVVA